MGYMTPSSFASFFPRLGFGPGRAEWEMIELGDGWFAEGGRVLHACSPDVRAHVLDDREQCECGHPVPRRVELFRDWLGRKSLRLLVVSAQVAPNDE